MIVVLFRPKSARLNPGGERLPAQAANQRAARIPRPIRTPGTRSATSLPPSPQASHPRTTNGINTGKESLAMSPSECRPATLIVLTSSRQKPPAWIRKVTCTQTAARLSTSASTHSGRRRLGLLNHAMVPIAAFVIAFGYLLSEILEAEFEF